MAVREVVDERVVQSSAREWVCGKKTTKQQNFPFFPVPLPSSLSPRFMQWKLNKNHNSRTCVCLFTTRAVYSSSCLLSLSAVCPVCLLIANNFYISFGPVKVDMCIFMLYMFIKSLCAALGAGWRMKTINFIAPLTLRSFVQISLSAALISTPHVCCTHSALACSVSHVKFI